MDNRPQLPDLFPDEKVVVESEQHQYETNPGSGGSVIEQKEYILNKAPIDNIIRVSGINREGSNVTFNAGIDYELSDDDERLVWKQSAEQLPEPESYFYVTYRADSIIKRYLDSNERELDSVDEQLTAVINGKFIDEASNGDLDEIGKLFGNPIGKRQGRDDEAYAAYLKSVVQSFVSRGTPNGIKLSVSAATGLNVEDITIEEDFVNNEYAVLIEPTTSVRGDIIEQVAEIADPSGVELLLTRFSTPPDEMSADDVMTIADEAASTSDSMAAADSFPHSGGTSPLNPIDATTSDTTSASDATNLNPVDGDVSDTASTDDTVVVETTSVAWGADWDDMKWN